MRMVPGGQESIVSAKGQAWQLEELSESSLLDSQAQSRD